MIKILFLGNKKLKPVTDTKDNRAFNLNIANLQKQKFEENKKNYLDPRNSNR